MNDIGFDEDFIESIFLVILICLDLIHLKTSKSLVNEWVIEDNKSY